MKFVLFLSLLWGAGGGAQAGYRPQVIYGADNRLEAFEVEDPGVQAALRGVAAFIPRTKLDVDASGRGHFQNEVSLGEARRLCVGERFVNEPTNAVCTAFLVAPDVLATAGHCATPIYCSGTYVVFGNQMLDARTSPRDVAPEDIYRCTRVIASEWSVTRDFALMQLDRAVTGRDPVRLATSAPRVNDAVYIAGFPGETPLKVAAGARVRSVGETNFTANLDSFGGNSGSPVLSLATNEVVGIISRGAADYVRDSVGQCYRSNLCADDGCQGETATFVSVLREALAASGR